MTPAELLERSQWDLFWMPADVMMHDRPEILYTVCPRDEPHLNCVARTRAPVQRVAALVQEVVSAHARVRSRWQVPDTFDVRPLEAALGSSGYVPDERHFAYVVQTDGFRPRSSSAVRVERVHDDKGLDDRAGVAERVFGIPRTRTEDERRIELEQMTHPESRAHYFVAYDAAGTPVASAGLTVFRELSFAFFWSGPARRDRPRRRPGVVLRRAWRRTGERPCRHAAVSAPALP